MQYLATKYAFLRTKCSFLSFLKCRIALVEHLSDLTYSRMITNARFSGSIGKRPPHSAAALPG